MGSMKEKIFDSVSGWILRDRRTYPEIKVNLEANQQQKIPNRFVVTEILQLDPSVANAADAGEH